MEKEKFEYVIKVDGKVVWKGLNPTKAYVKFVQNIRKAELQ